MNPQATGTDRGAETRRKHQDHIMPAVANYYAEPLVPESAKGMRVKDVDGREYLDFFGGILTVSVGHCDDRVGAAIKTQVDRLGHVSSLYPAMPVVELAERLAKITPGRLSKTIFNASGTEADDSAVVLAQVFTGALEIIALRYGYHGRGTLAQSLTGHAPWRAIPTQVPGVKHALAPYCYRCPLGLKYPDCNVKCADDLDELIRTTTTGRIAAFIAEPILGVGGFVTPPAEYFQKAVAIVRKYGGVFICDEVQTGFGRTGTHMFGITHWGVEPEIMTMAKGIANGMPLAACIATPEIADAFKKLTISTFGGNPVSCAAANAVLDIIEEENLPANSEARGARLRAGLEELQRRFPKTIGDVRGKGLMQAIELVADETNGDRTPNPAAVGRLFEETRKRGLLIGKGGFWGNALRISPPMIATDADIDEALAIFRASFEAMGAS